MNPTLIGLFAAVIWGISIPTIKIFQEQFGLFGYTAITFSTSGILGILYGRFRRDARIDPQVFSEPLFYLRWFSFVFHEALIGTAVWLVARENLPVVVLLNYFWPTAVIFCSVLLAGVKITRPWAAAAGSVIVIFSLALELLGQRPADAAMLSAPADWLAYLLAFTGAISWGLYSALSRRLGEWGGAGKVVPYFQLSLGLLAAPFAYFFSLPVYLAPELPISLLFGFYCLMQFVGYFCWDHGMRKGNVVYVSLGADFIPWISLGTTALLIRIEISALTLLSAGALVAGAMITRYGTFQLKNSPRDMVCEVPPE